MSTIDDMRQMQQQGMTEEQIVGAMQEKGLSYREISEALTQSKIKAAVEAPPTPGGITQPSAQAEQNYFQQETPPQQFAPEGTEYVQDQFQGMEQSIMQTPQPDQEYQQYSPQYTDYSSPQRYEQYEYGGAISADTISEIAEQVLSERLNEIRKAIEKIIDFKTSVEVKTESMNERLKRLERIIDTLQDSVLKKVGDYVNDIADIKKELIETQKSFTKIAGIKREKQPAQHHQEHHSPHYLDHKSNESKEHSKHHINHEHKDHRERKK